MIIVTLTYEERVYITFKQKTSKSHFGKQIGKNIIKNKLIQNMFQTI